MFAACVNFPKDRLGVLALAQALARASKDFRVPMAGIVQRCADISTYCPVPRELRNVAIGMRDEERARKEDNRNTKWESLYGPAQPEWSEQLLGIISGAKHEDRKRAMCVRAIRDGLFYTEGEGIEMGDRQFWEDAARRNVEKHPALVRDIRNSGGWQNERELQSDWVLWETPSVAPGAFKC